jgi:hypothetical protein
MTRKEHSEGRRRHVEPERLGSLEVNHKLELRRLLNRKISNLGSLQYPVDVRGGVPMKCGSLYRVSHQATRIGNRQQERIYGRQLVSSREFQSPGHDEQ